MREKTFLCKLQAILNMFDEIEEKIEDLDNWCNKQPEEQSEVDKLLSDYYHIIENNELSKDSMISIVQKIHSVRTERRDFDSTARLIGTYQKNKQKLLISPKSNRIMLRQSIKQTMESLHQEYQYRVLSDVEVNSFTKTIEKGKITKEQLEEDLKNGLTQKEIAKKYNTKQPYISLLCKKYNLRKEKKC